MSSKTSKKSAAQLAPPSASSQPASTSTPITRRNRPESPLSPTRISRLQEKQDLQNLNDRLACYIDRVRHLENENSRLSREVQSTQEVVTREVTSIKSMYEHELSDARKLLDETARERAKLEIDTKRLWDSNEDLKNKLDKAVKDLEIAERNLMIYETRCNDLQSQFNQVQADRKKMAERERQLEKEVEKLNMLNEETRKHLEEETLQRIDLENHIQSLKEDISFKDQVYQQELSETRTKRQVDISEIDGRLAEQYEAKLQQTLQELRDQYESQMRANREEIEMLYENKIKNVTSQAQRNVGATNLVVEELRQARQRIEALNERINELEGANTTLNTKLRESENFRESEKARQAENLAAMENELTQLRDDMARQIQDYQDLMDIRVALDLEIAAYRKLLESEEARLNITPVQSSNLSSGGRSTPSRQTPVRTTKRKRTLMEENESISDDFSVSGTSKGDIEIAEADPLGRFVKLKNKGNKELSLSGWQIIRNVGSLETIFKFHRTAKLESNGIVTVWSADIGINHEPPSNIVMKGQKWFFGDHMTTKLLNNDGEEMATSERKKQKMSSTMQRHRESISRMHGELHHQQGDPTNAERCHLM